MISQHRAFSHAWIGGDRFDQSADNLLQGCQRAVDLGFGDRSVLGIDDDRAHGGLRERVAGQTGALSFHSPVHPFPAGLSLSAAAGSKDAGGIRTDRAAGCWRRRGFQD
jgi:hypothetical protein